MRPYLAFVLRFRWAVLAASLLVTALLARQVTNLRVIIDPNSFLPADHPYVVATNEVEERFGSEYVLVIGLTATEGDIYQPALLEKLRRLTAEVEQMPGVVTGNVLSLSARKAKDIVGGDEGMTVTPILETVPDTAESLAALREAIERNPAYLGTIVSADHRTTAIIADFKDPGAAGFRSIVERVRPIVDRERDPSVTISLGGLPSYLTHMEENSNRMALLFPLAVLITGLIHYEAFRTLQGLVLPLVTALFAVVWALGIMGWAGVPMDVFNVTTPILILAVAAGHAVQILKRYYEEYHRLRGNAAIGARQANDQAILESVSRTGPVMITAGVVAACSFLSLIIFKLGAVKTFGVFTGFGILSALALEMTFIPALRSVLPPPGQRERRRERERRAWDRVVEAIARWVAGPRRRTVYAAAAVLIAVSAAGASRVVADETFKDIFFESTDVVRDDQRLNTALAGTNNVYVLVEGADEGTLKRPDVLRAMEATQRWLEEQPHVGKTLSLVDFVKRMNRAMHGDAPAADRIPDSEALVSQYLLLYSMSGDPGDFDTYVDYEYRSASIWAFLKTDSNAYFGELAPRLMAFMLDTFPPDIRVSLGGSVPQASAVRDTIIESKLLNIVQVAGVVLLIASIVFRSLVGGLLVLLPVLAAVLANFGIMGWLGFPLNAPNSMTSAMAIGIGADYAIYLIFRIREEFRRGASDTEALTAALTTAGKAILFVATAIAGGYLVLLLSQGFYWYIWMAVLIAAAMVVSSITALTLIPSLILSWRPRFIFGDAGMPTRTPAPLGATGVVLLLAAALPMALGAQAPSAADVMERNYHVSRVADSVSDAKFRLINKSGQERERHTVTTTKLLPNGVDNQRLVRFQSPPDVKGTGILLIEDTEEDDDVWIYLPGLKKVRRLVSSNKKDSFAGTDFSYGDVIGHRVADWTHRFLPEETVDGQRCWVIESTPATDEVASTSGYSKRVSWIRQDNAVQVKGEFWDRAGRLFKRALFRDVRLVDRARGRWQAMQLEAENVQTGHRTVIALENFKVNQGVKDEFFTTRYLESER